MKTGNKRRKSKTTAALEHQLEEAFVSTEEETSQTEIIGLENYKNTAIESSGGCLPYLGLTKQRMNFK